MKPRHATSLDANHTQIVKHLRSHGVEVADFAGSGKVPDCQTFYGGVARWMEIKVPTRKAMFPAMQLDYIANTKMPVAFVTNEQDALEYAKTGKGALTQRQKDSLAGLLVRNKGKKAFTVGQVSEALNS
jgi:hypothetical protein